MVLHYHYHMTLSPLFFSNEAILRYLCQSHVVICIQYILEWFSSVYLERADLENIKYIICYKHMQWPLGVAACYTAPLKREECDKHMWPYWFHVNSFEWRHISVKVS